MKSNYIGILVSSCVRLAAQWMIWGKARCCWTCGYNSGTKLLHIALWSCTTLERVSEWTFRPQRQSCSGGGGGGGSGEPPTKNIPRPSLSPRILFNNQIRISENVGSRTRDSMHWKKKKKKKKIIGSTHQALIKGSEKWWLGQHSARGILRR